MFGTAIAAYLFCGGTGAGASCVLALMGLLVPRDRVSQMFPTPGGLATCRFSASGEYRRLFGGGFALAAFALVAGVCFLMGDAGTASAALLVIANPTPTLLSVGSYALVVALALSVLLAAAWGLPGGRVRYGIVRAALWAMLVAGLVVAAYTGLLLSSMPAVPVWHTPWLAVLFVASSLSCGCAIVMMYACAAGSFATFRTVIGRVSTVDIAVLALEALAVAGFLVAAFGNAYEAAARGAEVLLSGALSGLFVFGFIGVGVVAPAVAELLMAVGRKRAPGVLAAVSAAVLVGGFALRYCIVSVGSHPEVWAVVT